MDYNNILVAVDQSKNAEIAVNKAIEMAKRNNAQLTLLHVLDVDSISHEYSIPFYEEVEELNPYIQNAKDSLEKYSDLAKKAGVRNVLTDVQEGSPKLVISEEYPDDHNIDLIVIGATGMGNLQRMIIGSTTAFVVRHARIDVIVAKTNDNL